MKTPIITICGRPNVGKSTLFNRLTGQRKSIVSDIPGTTRDLIHMNCEWNQRRYILVDSGGIDQESNDEITSKVSAMSFDSVKDADHVLFLVDALSNVTVQDIEILKIIRKYGNNISLVINKVDNSAREENLNEFYKLGLGDGLKISAHHGHGVYDLMDSMNHLFVDEKEDSESVKFSLIGRPNVGKSTIFNCAVGESKSIVDSTPGTTRDSVDSKVSYENEDYTIVDTAGIRRRGKRKDIEFYSVIRTVKSISDSNLSVLVIDSTEQVTAQDQHIAGFIRESGNGCVVVMNKSDLVSRNDIDENEIIEKLKFFPGIPFVYTSALKNKGIDGMFQELSRVNSRYEQLFDQDNLWKNIVNIISSNIPPSKGKRKIYPKSAKQIGTKPPKIQIKFKNAELIHFSYKRYIENELRKIFDLKGVPLQLEIIES